MRKAILILAVAIAILSVFGASALRARVSAIAPEVGAQIEKKLGTRIELGEVSVSFFPLAAEIRDVVVSGRQQSVQPFLVIDKVRVRPALLPLVMGRLSVRSITLRRPTFQLLRNDRDGRLSSYVPDGLAASLARLPFEIEVRDGTVLRENRTSDPPVASLRVQSVYGRIRGGDEGRLHIDLEGAPLGPGSSGRLRLAYEPGVGPTGGDDVELELDVHRGSVAALKGAFESLSNADIRDPVQLSLRADGLYGEQSTLSTPAEPLFGTLRGSVGMAVAGKEDRLDLDLAVAVDDSRFEVRSGKGTWGDFAFEATAWMTRGVPYKLSAKIDVEPFELEEVAAAYGVDERWRPRGRAEDFVLRVTGTAMEPLFRYEAKVPEIEFRGWQDRLAVKAGPAAVTGSVLAVNTDISASFRADELRVGSARIDDFVFGTSYWRERISVTSLGTSLYGGTIDGSLAIFPKVSSDVLGGGLLRDADVETLIRNVVPGLPVRISGRADIAVQIGSDEQGPWVVGRAGIHRGRIDGSNWAREIVSRALDDAGAADALDSVTRSQRRLLAASDATAFERMAVDFETRGAVITLPRVVVDLPGAQVRGRGRIAEDRSVSIEAALWPGDGVAASLLQASAALGRARNAAGEMALPFMLGITGTESEWALTAESAAALRGAAEAPAVLTPIEVGPAAFPDLPPLKQQFGR